MFNVLKQVPFVSRSPELAFLATGTETGTSNMARFVIGLFICGALNKILFDLASDLFSLAIPSIQFKRIPTGMLAVFTQYTIAHTHLSKFI
jgi:hypothetical protein